MTKCGILGFFCIPTAKDKMFVRGSEAAAQDLQGIAIPITDPDKAKQMAENAGLDTKRAVAATEIDMEKLKQKNEGLPANQQLTPQSQAQQYCLAFRNHTAESGNGIVDISAKPVNPEKTKFACVATTVNDL